MASYTTLRICNFFTLCWYASAISGELPASTSNITEEYQVPSETYQWNASEGLCGSFDHGKRRINFRGAGGNQSSPGAHDKVPGEHEKDGDDTFIFLSDKYAKVDDKNLRKFGKNTSPLFVSGKNTIQDDE